MFTYNISTKVDKEISQQWVQWQKEECIPEIMATNLFTEIKFYKLVEPVDKDDDTFILQYCTDAKVNYDTYINEYADSLRKRTLQKWGFRFIDFGTLMQTVH